MIRLTPFVIFEGDCVQAMAFYQSCVGGELAITRVGETPMKNFTPSNAHDRVAYAQLRSGSIEISATDWAHPTRQPKHGNTVALYISGGTYDELRTIFDRLAVGADPALLDDLRDMPFGSYGHLADKFGVHWFFQGDARLAG
jgi:PhnB protein